MTTINADMLAGTIAATFRAHDERANSPSKRFRKWDGRTPYGIHPTWAALTILTEIELDERLREIGAWVLLNHDLYEDTTADLILPKETLLRSQVALFVGDMTKKPGQTEEDRFWEAATGKDEVILFRLYDKTSNLLDGSWMDTEKRKGCVRMVEQFADAVFRIYGDLNIVRIARAITGQDAR